MSFPALSRACVRRPNGGLAPWRPAAVVAGRRCAPAMRSDRWLLIKCNHTSRCPVLVTCAAVDPFVLAWTAARARLKTRRAGNSPNQSEPRYGRSSTRSAKDRCARSKTCALLRQLWPPMQIGPPCLVAPSASVCHCGIWTTRSLLRACRWAHAAQFVGRRLACDHVEHPCQMTA
eukprot:4809882-Pyramimonas_sp.AAC.1